MRKGFSFPRTEFVDRFMGESNLIRREKDNPVEMQLWEMACQRVVEGERKIFGHIPQMLAVRSEDIKLDMGSGALTGHIVGKNYHGSVINYQLQFINRLLKVQTSADWRYESGQEVGFSIARATCVYTDDYVQ